uniref:CAAX prenyl protease 2 n=1 Tax=Fundulus heteroclitus TaxID=8078 RepID=A0A3Q2Q3L2_FUNHE
MSKTEFLLWFSLSMDCPWSFIDGIRVVLDPCFWTLCLSDMRWLRNQVVAPLTEELVFRACMLPMLVPCAGPTTAIFTCPLFFGSNHFEILLSSICINDLCAYIMVYKGSLYEAVCLLMSEAEQFVQKNDPTPKTENI